jgi:hypothetical protein
MKKSKLKDEPLVQADREGQKPEKLWFVQYATIRRHSRVLYLPLDPTVVRLRRLKKGDVIKYMMLELTRAPSEDEPIRDVSETESADEGEL